MTLLYDLIRCRQLLWENGAGRMGSIVLAPIFYVVGYRHAEAIARASSIQRKDEPDS